MPFKIICLLVCLFIFNGCALTRTEVQTSREPQNHAFVKANHTAIDYFGRYEWRGSTPVSTWPGSGLRFLTDASELSIVFDDRLGKNFYNVFIDKNYAKAQILELEQGHQVMRIELPIQTSLDRESVLVEIFRRTEGQDGETIIEGFHTNQNASFTAAPPLPDRRIEIYGDSITTGMGNEAPLDAPDDKRRDKNNFMAYGSIAARMLNAQVMNTSQSGIGVTTSWFDYTMPDLYRQSNAHFVNASRWDFTLYPADLVIINLFQNDSWLIEKNLNPVPNGQQIVEAYVQFVEKLLPHYEHATFLFLLGSMDAVAPTSKWPAYVQHAEAMLAESHPHRSFDSLILPYQGYDKHPRRAEHKANALLLAKHVTQLMNW